MRIRLRLGRAYVIVISYEENMPRREKIMNPIHFLRVAMSFALLGAVIAGVLSGDRAAGIDLRYAGAAIGLAIGFVMAKRQREDHRIL